MAGTFASFARRERAGLDDRATHKARGTCPRGEIVLRNIALGAAVLVLVGALGFSLSQAATPQEADALYSAADWAKAEKAYRELTEHAPDNAIYKYRLAVTLRNQSKLQAAGMWLDQAKGGAVPDAYIEVERARLMMAKGDRAGAMRALELAAEEGYANGPAIQTDTALESLASDQRFVDVITKMNMNRVPCEYIAEFSQFDFWLGEWRVVGPNGVFQGTNRIEKEQGGCLLMEHWTGAGGTTGTSMNFYDLNRKEWVQVWISPGLQLEIRGGLVDGSMVLTGHAYDIQEGHDRPFRGTWTPMEDGVVRQHFEESSNGGQTWTTWFDGYYHPLNLTESKPD